MAETAPRPGEEPAHDVLAAEAFAVPAPDPDLRHPPVLPEDPSGIPEAHDILAAEEFAMPAVHRGPGGDGKGRREAATRPALVVGGLLAALAFLHRRRNKA